MNADNRWPTADAPADDAPFYARLAERLGALIGAQDYDTVLVPGEAIVALEAVARETGANRLRVLNVATSTYGALFGQWIEEEGGSVTTIAPATPGQPIPVTTVADELAKGYDALAFVHGEAATAIVNPIREILTVAQGLGIATIIDAVASVGAEPLDLAGPDAADIVVLGPQKALAGPAGISAVSLSTRGWELLARRRGRVASFSSVSLLDIRRDWLDAGKVKIPGTPAPHELWALDAALHAVEHEQISAVVRRHRRAAAAARAGVSGLGLHLWVERIEESSGLLTAALLPHDVDPDAVINLAHTQFGVTLTHAPEGIDGRLIKLPHTGRQAQFAAVVATVAGLGGALRTAGHTADVAAGVDAVVAAYADDANRDADPG
ncbi:MAG: aminotransferase class V-fold PLP-dependent enzyme [Gordonia sp. (in: high G+C Gram-positive bacteria)]